MPPLVRTRRMPIQYSIDELWDQYVCIQFRLRFECEYVEHLMIMLRLPQSPRHPVVTGPSRKILERANLRTQRQTISIHNPSLVRRNYAWDDDDSVTRVTVQSASDTDDGASVESGSTTY